MTQPQMVKLWLETKQLAADHYFKVEVSESGKFGVYGPDDKCPFQLFDTVEGVYGFIKGVKCMQDYNAVKRFDNRSALQTVWDNMVDQQKARTSKENIADVLETLTIIKEGTVENQA